VPPGGFLTVDEIPIHGNFKLAGAALDKSYTLEAVSKLVNDLRRQPGGPGTVISGMAKANFDLQPFPPG
jgi:hypothetical protein